MRFLRRFRKDPNLRKVVVPAVELGFVLGPHLLHSLNGFPGLGPAMVEISAHDFGFFTQPTSANTEYEPTSRVIVKRCDLLSLNQRIMFRNQTDARAQHNLSSSP